MGFLQRLFGEKKNALLDAPVDYSLFFSSNQYDGIELKHLELGDLFLPTGKIVACDPLVFLRDWEPFNKNVNPGKYPVTVCVAKTENSGDRYAVVQVKFSYGEPVKWKMALSDDRKAEELKNPGDYVGFPVDAGLGCFCDFETQKLYKQFEEKFYISNPEGNIYDDYFAAEFKNNAEDKEDPNDIGDWLNYNIPDSEDMNVIMFHSGYGDGYYPCYWGLDKSDNICRLIVDFMVFDL